MKVFHKDKLIYTGILGEDYKKFSNENKIYTDVLLPKILNLFPDKYEQARLLNTHLIIVVGSGQDTILLDIVY